MVILFACAMHRDWTFLTSPPGTCLPCLLQCQYCCQLQSQIISDLMYNLLDNPLKGQPSYQHFCTTLVLFNFFQCTLRPHLIFFILSSFSLSGLVFPSFHLFSPLSSFLLFVHFPSSIIPSLEFIGILFILHAISA